MADDDDYPLIPAPEAALTPEEDLAAAEASLIGDDAAADTTPVPYGRTPRFNFEKGRFDRAGRSPVWVTGLEALKQRLLMAAYTERFQHPEVFTARFGMEGREDPIGEAANIDDAMSDWAASLTRAWLAIDRVEAVEIESLTFDPVAQSIQVGWINVTTDDENDELKIEPFVAAIGQG